MQNLLENEYTKNNIKYLLLKNVFVGSKYYPIIRDYLGDVSYKFLENNRILLVDEGQSAILQLENYCNLFVIKILYSIEGINLEGILNNVVTYISELIKLSGISVNVANTIGYRVYIYHYLKLNNYQYVRTTGFDIFENSIGFEANEFIKNLQFDNNYNINNPNPVNFSLFSNPNVFVPKQFAAPFSPTANRW